MKNYCIFRTKKENLYDYIAQNKGLTIVYGMTFFAGVLAECGNIKIDLFCDQKAFNAADLLRFHNIPVYDIDRIQKLVNADGRRATVIICVGIIKSTVSSIYKDLQRVGINADVFDYFENESVFSDSEFTFRGKKYMLFEHPFNCGYINSRMTERSVELSLAKEYADKCSGPVTEIGAVTPYYFLHNKITEIMDPTDSHKCVTRKSIFDCDLKGKNILSISTVEHIGTSDYGMCESETSVDAVKKILNEADSCLITAPLGYNHLLDKWVSENWGNRNVRISILKRNINNHWEELSGDYISIEYTPLWANGLLIIEK